MHRLRHAAAIETGAATDPVAAGERPPLLEARDVSKYFGAVVAHRGRVA